MISTQLVPSHFKKFSCIGSDCENHCCQGWIVSIDKKTYKKYKNSSDDSLAKNIKRHKGSDENMPYASIKMKECGTCPFLMNNGLCHIHATHGEELLSSVCSTFPRIKNIYNNVLEQSLYLSCPEAARITLLNPEPMEFDLETSEKINLNMISLQSESINEKSTFSPHFFLLRSIAIELIQNRTWDLKTRLLLLGFWIQQLEKLEGSTFTDIELKNLWAQFIKTHSEHIKNGVFDSFINEIKGIEKRFIIFFQALFSSRIEQRNSYEKYQLLVSKLMDNIGWESGTITEWTCNYFKAKKQSSHLIFEKEYVLEQFLINEIFKDWFPFGEDTMWNHYLSLILHFTVLRIHFMSIIMETSKLNDVDIIESVHLYIRSSLHRKSYINSILDYAKDNDMNDLASVVLMLNC